MAGYLSRLSDCPFFWGQGVVGWLEAKSFGPTNELLFITDTAMSFGHRWRFIIIRGRLRPGLNSKPKPPN